MVVEEATLIMAPLGTVWQQFTDLTCWAEWNTVLRDVSAAETIRQGESFSCSIRPFVMPLYFRPEVREVLPRRKVVWRGRKFGITALHEFLFDETEEGVRVTSRERFSGFPVVLMGPAFPWQRIRGLTKAFLSDLKQRAESLSSIMKHDAPA